MSKKPTPKPLPHDVPWILQRVRALFLGREHNSPLRFVQDVSKRTQPLPNLPLGPSSTIRNNYYCDRDPRGDVTHPEVLVDVDGQQARTRIGPPADKPDDCKPTSEAAEAKQEEEFGETMSSVVKKTPGKPWNWDSIDNDPSKECCRINRDGY